MFFQLPNKCLVGNRAQIAQRYPAKHLVQQVRVGAELPKGLLGGEFPKQPAQIRLRGGAEHGSDPVMLNQLGNGRNAGAQIIAGERLRLVENQDAVGKVVQLAAAAGAVGIQRLEKLHGGGYDNRRVPVFTGEKASVLRGRQIVLFHHFVICGGKVGQYVFFAQQVGEGLCGLVDDGGVGDDVDHPVQPVGSGVLQREGQRGKGLSAAGGHGEGINAAGAGAALLQAGLEHLIALRAHRRRCGAGQIAVCLDLHFL